MRQEVVLSLAMVLCRMSPDEAESSWLRVLPLLRLRFPDAGASGVLMADIPERPGHRVGQVARPVASLRVE